MRPHLFIEAARHIYTDWDPERGGFCCNVLLNIAPDTEHKEFKFFRAMFGPKKDTTDVWWNFSDGERNKRARSIALLLCAEMARDLTKEKQK